MGKIRTGAFAGARVFKSFEELPGIDSLRSAHALQKSEAERRASRERRPADWDAERGNEAKRIRVAKELGERYSTHMKKAFHRSLVRTTAATIDFIPKEHLAELAKRFRIGEGPLQQRHLINRLIGRIVVLPAPVFQEFSNLLGFKKKREILGIHYKGRIFVSEKARAEGRIDRTVSHETIHLINNVLGLGHKNEFDEAFAYGLSYFLAAELSRKRKSQPLFRRKPRGSSVVPKDYARQQALGIKISDMAVKISREKGGPAAAQFFRQLFMEGVASDSSLAEIAAQLHAQAMS